MAQTLTLADAKANIAACIDLDIPAYLEGPPGIGKSEVIAQIAAERGAEFVDIRLSMFDPVDLRGLPVLDGAGGTVWARPAIWPTREDVETILLFDEIDRAPPAVLNAALQIVLNRRIGEHELPASVRIVAAANGSTDRNTNRLPAALANRFAHFSVAYDAGALRDYFETIQIDPLITAFLHLRPALGYTAPAEGEKAFATPRQWALVNRALSLPGAVRWTVVQGLIGHGPAMEFRAFYELASRISIPAILADPAGYPVPSASDVGTMFAAATGLSRVATRANFADVATYLDRLPVEFGIMAIQAACRRDQSLMSTATYRDWAIENQDVQI